MNSILGLSMLTLASMLAYVFTTMSSPSKGSQVGRILALVLVALPCWIGGLVLHLTALDVSARQRSAAFAAVGANLGLGWQLLVVKPEVWWMGLFHALWPAYAGLLVGALWGGRAAEDGRPAGAIGSEGTKRA